MPPGAALPGHPGADHGRNAVRRASDGPELHRVAPGYDGHARPI